MSRNPPLANRASSVRIAGCRAVEAQTPDMKRLVAIFCAIALFSSVQLTASSADSVTNILSQPLSLVEAVNIALAHNPSVLKSQKELQASHGIAVQTRAIVIPTLKTTGQYQIEDRALAESFSPLRQDQNWGLGLRLVQSVYEGGRMKSALRSAKLTMQQAELRHQDVLLETVLLAETAYFDILLAAQQIDVQEASVKLLEQELNNTKRRFEAGVVPQFNVLRAEVEVANARPRLIRARNSHRIAKNNLANVLGYDLPSSVWEDIPLNLTTALEETPYKIDLQNALNQALTNRTDLAANRKALLAREEDVKFAKAANLPSLQGFVGYDVRNSILTDDISVEKHGWVAGAQVSWDIFDGLRTQGRVEEARARVDQAEIAIDELRRRIELDVRTAFTNFNEAREVLDSNRKVLEQAAEALRLATSRYSAGTGTQLDVLSAQTALTDARSTQVQALRDYQVAVARFERVVGLRTSNGVSK